MNHSTRFTLEGWFFFLFLAILFRFVQNFFPFYTQTSTSSLNWTEYKFTWTNRNKSRLPRANFSWRTSKSFRTITWFHIPISASFLTESVHFVSTFKEYNFYHRCLVATSKFFMTHFKIVQVIEFFSFVSHKQDISSENWHYCTLAALGKLFLSRGITWNLIVSYNK